MRSIQTALLVGRELGGSVQSQKAGGQGTLLLVPLVSARACVVSAQQRARVSCSEHRKYRAEERTRGRGEKRVGGGGRKGGDKR